MNGHAKLPDHLLYPAVHPQTQQQPPATFPATLAGVLLATHEPQAAAQGAAAATAATAVASAKTWEPATWSARALPHQEHPGSSAVGSGPPGESEACQRLCPVEALGWPKARPASGALTPCDPL